MKINSISGAKTPISGNKNPLMANFVSIKNNPQIMRQNSININPNFARFVYLSRFGT